ncbi:hypothetical protein ACHQM5_002134 [Ranunculus cassubicifolius]
MVSSNIKDILTSFDPSSDFFAITSGDGRIKIWDTLKGQVQTEFADLTTTDITDMYAKSQTGHLSLDYTCMKWLPLERKKKKKNVRSLLALGTSGGDVVALDVTVGDLKWKFSDCHPGGVHAVSYSTQSSCIFSAGADGMVCQIDFMSGSLLGKFKASTKAISSMAISSDGSMLATAAAQLKVFNCSDNKKMQKFSGHTVSVRCLSFTEDGKYILSSAVGERYIAIWKVDGSKKQSASCVLSMEHPAVFLHSKCTDNSGTDNVGLYVLAISELGVCYFWYGKDIEDLRNAKPTKITLSTEDHNSKSHKSVSPMIFSAEFQGIVKPGCVHVLFAYGSLIKPSFEKQLLQYGVDLNLNSTQSGVLLPAGLSHKSVKNQAVTRVTALDRGNAEDALLPNPKFHDSHGKKKRRHSSTDGEDVMALDIIDKSQAMQVDNADKETDEEGDTGAICMESELRKVGLIDDKDEPSVEGYPRIVIKSGLEATMPQRKIKTFGKSTTSPNAYTLLKVLVATWKSRVSSGNHTLPRICGILVYHSDYVVSQKASPEMLNSLHEMGQSKAAAIQPLLQLAGRMQLIKSQIDKAGTKNTEISSFNDQLDEEDESEDEDVDEQVYGEDDDSLTSSDDDE